jgi:hypothetical protein
MYKGRIYGREERKVKNNTNLYNALFLYSTRHIAHETAICCNSSVHNLTLDRTLMTQHLSTIRFYKRGDLTEDAVITQLSSKAGIPDKWLFSRTVCSYDILHTRMWYSFLVTLYAMGKG